MYIYHNKKMQKKTSTEYKNFKKFLEVDQHGNNL